MVSIQIELEKKNQFIEKMHLKYLINQL